MGSGLLSHSHHDRLRAGQWLSRLSWHYLGLGSEASMSCVLCLSGRLVLISIVLRETIDDRSIAGFVDNMLPKTMGDSQQLIFTIGGPYTHLRRVRP